MNITLEVTSRKRLRLKPPPLSVQVYYEDDGSDVEKSTSTGSEKPWSSMRSTGLTQPASMAMPAARLTNSSSLIERLSGVWQGSRAIQLPLDARSR